MRIDRKRVWSRKSELFLALVGIGGGSANATVAINLFMGSTDVQKIFWHSITALCAIAVGIVSTVLFCKKS